MILKLKLLVEKSGAKKSYLLLCIYSFLIGVIMLGSSFVFGQLTETLILSNYSELFFMFSLYVSLEVVAHILNFHKNNKESLTLETTCSTFKKNTMEHYLNAKIEFTSSIPQGDMLGRLDRDISSVTTALEILVSAVHASVLFLIMTLGLLLFDYRLFLSFLVSFLLIVPLQLISAKKSDRYIMPWKVALGNSNALSQNILNNKSTITPFTLYKPVKKWIEEALNDSKNKGIKGVLTIYFIQLPLTILSYLPMVTVLLAGVYLVSVNDITLSVFIASVFIAQLASNYLNPIVGAFINIPQLLSSLNRLESIWDSPLENFGATQGKKEPLLEFRNVSFSYENQVILDQLTFAIFENDSVGLVGASGSGKSTIFKLINGFYTPTKGDIFVKGVNVKDWDKKAYRDIFANINQKPSFFNASIRTNLKMVNSLIEDVDLDKLLESLDLSLSLDMILEEHAQNISGGEQQRLNIARAIASSRKFLLIDEATSALDYHTEQAIVNLLSKKKHDETQFIISHRMSSLMYCDRIIVLKNGAIIESGSHDSLMNLHGEYCSLVMKDRGDSHE